MKRLFPLLFLLAGCATKTPQPTAFHSQSALEEVRIALIDVRQAFSAQQMDIQLLEEKLDRLKPHNQQQLTRTLEARIEKIETAQNSIKSDLQQLAQHANQTTSSLHHYKGQINALESLLNKQNERLNEITKLRGTLDSISKAIGSGDASTSSPQIHKVRSGDSLDKIARKYNTTVQKLKQANGLTSNTILIGQKLKIPN